VQHVARVSAFVSLLSRPGIRLYIRRPTVILWEASMDEVANARASIDPADSRAAASALVHDYSRRYIAASPQRMEQLLAAYRSSKEPSAEDDDGIDEQS